MMRTRVAVAVAVVVVVVVAVVAMPALAFRPSATWLFNRVMERSHDRGTTSLRVDASTTTWTITGAPVVEGAAERTWLSAPGRLRRELDVDKGHTTEVRADGRLLSQTPGQPDKKSNAGVDLLAEIMTAMSSQDSGPAAQRLIGALKALGINTEVVSYSRFDGRVAFVVGSKPWETDKPQLWLDKDLLVPLRLVTLQKDGANMVRIDTRYLGWGSPVGGSWYPQVIEVWRGDAVIRRSVTEDLERNIEIDSALYAIP